MPGAVVGNAGQETSFAFLFIMARKKQEKPEPEKATLEGKPDMPLYGSRRIFKADLVLEPELEGESFRFTRKIRGE